MLKCIFALDTMEARSSDIRFASEPSPLNKAPMAYDRCEGRWRTTNGRVACDAAIRMVKQELVISRAEFC